MLLPSKAHADIAGTDVIKDLIFRRRKDGETPNQHEWYTTGTVGYHGVSATTP